MPAKAVDAQNRIVIRTPRKSETGSPHRPTLMQGRSSPTRAQEAPVRLVPDVTTRVMPVRAGHALGLRCGTTHSGIENGAPSQERGAFGERSFTRSGRCVGPTPERQSPPRGARLTRRADGCERSHHCAPRLLPGTAVAGGPHAVAAQRAA